MDKMTIFIALVAVAILLQVVILFALYMAVRRMQAVAEKFQSRAMPLVEHGRELMVDLAPKLRQIGSNALETSELARMQAHELSRTLTAFNETARVHINRANDVINNTMSKVERTADTMQHSVMSPVRKVNGLIAAISAGLDSLRGVDRMPSQRRYGSDEGFI